MAFSFQLIILLEQFGLLKSTEEDSFILKSALALLAKILAYLWLLWS